MGARSGNERETFWRISTNEPPDLESQLEQRRLKEQKARPVSNERKVEFSSREALLQAIQSWAAHTPQDVHGLTVFVRASDSSWRFSLRHSGDAYYVEMPVIQKSADQAASGLVYAPARSMNEPELPTRFALPKPQAEKFRRWLTDRRLAFTDSSYEARGTWQIEGYYRTIHVNLKSDRDSLLSITRYLINGLFQDTQPPYHFVTVERSGGQSTTPTNSATLHR